MSTVDEWSERWDFGDTEHADKIPYNQQKTWSDGGQTVTNGSVWSNEFENEDYEDEFKKNDKENNNKTNIKVINGFDAPYVTRLYQLCYDTGIEGESLGSNVEEWSTKDKDFQTSFSAEKSEKPQDEEKKYQNIPQQNGVDEIRGRLAPEVNGGDEQDDKRPKKNSLQTAHQLRLSLTDLNGESIETISVQHSGNTENSIEINDISNNEKIVANGTAEEAKSVIEKQAKLEAEARIALAQAKHMARMQMEVEKQRKKKSPIAEMVGIQFPDGKYKLSRQTLSHMNFAQIQVILNDLHTQIESLNGELVELLEERDDLLLEQDTMLHRVEGLTPY